MLQSPGWSTEIKLTSYACLYLPANAQPSFSDIENATTTITPCHRDGAICNCYAALHSREVGHGVYPTLFLGGSHLLHNPTSHVSLVNPTSHVSSVSTASGFDLEKSLGVFLCAGQILIPIFRTWAPCRKLPLVFTSFVVRNSVMKYLNTRFLPLTSTQAMRGNHTQAKHLFWRAIHACPGEKSVWMDALRGNQIARMGAAGLRPAFRTKELNELVDAMLEKTLHLRAEPP